MSSKNDIFCYRTNCGSFLRIFIQTGSKCFCRKPVFMNRINIYLYIFCPTAGILSKDLLDEVWSNLVHPAPNCSFLARSKIESHKGKIFNDFQPILNLRAYKELRLSCIFCIALVEADHPKSTYNQISMIHHKYIEMIQTIFFHEVVFELQSNRI